MSAADGSADDKADATKKFLETQRAHWMQDDLALAEQMLAERMLAEHGLADGRSKNDNDLLVQAARHGNTDWTAILLERNICCCYAKQGASLLAATRQGHEEIVRMLIEHEDKMRETLSTEEPEYTSEYQHPNGFKDLALIEAAKIGDLKIARFLLHHGACADALNSHALVQAVQHKHNDVAFLLLEHGADPSMPIMFEKRRGHAHGLLFLAATTDADVPLVQVLLKRGLFLSGYLAMVHASAAKNVQLISLLSHLPFAWDAFLHGQMVRAACEGDSKSLSKMIVEQGAIPLFDLKDYILPAAIEGDHVDVVRVLFSHFSSSGDSVILRHSITLAIQKGRPLVFEFLVVALLEKEPKNESLIFLLYELRDTESLCADVLNIFLRHFGYDLATIQVDSRYTFVSYTLLEEFLPRYGIYVFNPNRPFDLNGFNTLVMIALQRKRMELIRMLFTFWETHDIPLVVDLPLLLIHACQASCVANMELIWNALSEEQSWRLTHSIRRTCFNAICANKDEEGARFFLKQNLLSREEILQTIIVKCYAKIMPNLVREMLVNDDGSNDDSILRVLTHDQQLLCAARYGLENLIRDDTDLSSMDPISLLRLAKQSKCKTLFRVFWKALLRNTNRSASIIFPFRCLFTALFWKDVEIMEDVFAMFPGAFSDTISPDFRLRKDHDLQSEILRLDVSCIEFVLEWMSKSDWKDKSRHSIRLPVWSFLFEDFVNKYLARPEIIEKFVDAVHQQNVSIQEERRHDWLEYIVEQATLNYQDGLVEVLIARARNVGSPIARAPNLQRKYEDTKFLRAARDGKIDLLTHFTKQKQFEVLAIHRVLITALWSGQNEVLRILHTSHQTNMCELPWHAVYNIGISGEHILSVLLHQTRVSYSFDEKYELACIIDRASGYRRVLGPAVENWKHDDRVRIQVFSRGIIDQDEIRRYLEQGVEFPFSTFKSVSLATYLFEKTNHATLQTLFSFHLVTQKKQREAYVTQWMDLFFFCIISSRDSLFWLDALALFLTTCSNYEVSVMTTMTNQHDFDLFYSILGAAVHARHIPAVKSIFTHLSMEEVFNSIRGDGGRMIFHFAMAEKHAVSTVLQTLQEHANSVCLCCRDACHGVSYCMFCILAEITIRQCMFDIWTFRFED